MKKCYTCQQDKSPAEFNKNKTKKDGLNDICQGCSRLRSRQYYRENKTKHLKAVRIRKQKHRIRNKKFVYQHLLSNPCVDCNEKNPVVLEFDHKEGKIDNVSVMTHSPVTLLTLKKEIYKCDVRCANCHRIKTAKEQNWWKLTGPVV